MSRKHTRAALFASLIALAGCVDTGDESMIIVQNQTPGEGCTISATRSAVFIGRGVIDIAPPGTVPAPNGYLFTPVVESRLVGTGDEFQRSILVEGANVDLSFDETFFSAAEVDGLGALASFSQVFAGTLDAGGSLGLAFDILPEGMLAMIGGKLADGDSTIVFANVSIYGTSGGGDVTSNVFPYPVEVCKGCLWRNVGNCTELTAGFTAAAGGTCQALQDGFLDCCTASDSSTVCPATLEAPMAR